MPISTISQTISTIPEAGRRGVDVQTVFVNKQEDFQDHLQGTTVTELNALKTQINTTVSGMNDAVTTVNTKANEASTSASQASSSASTATTKAGEASTSASQALASKNKAAQWADNNYNVEVEAGKYSAKHWATVAQSVDVSTKVDKDMSGYTAKTTPVDADLLPLSDSASSFGIKKLSLMDLKTTIFTNSTLTGTPTAPTQTVGDNSTKVATTEFVQNNKAVSVPAGTIIAFASTTAPSGYLKANGALLSRAAYAALFAVIGTTYGSGDGSTTFNLPDLRGEFVRGFADGRDVDVGRTFGSAQADELKAHSHPVVKSAATEGTTSDGAGIINRNYSNYTATNTVLETGGVETRPRNIALLYCIKY